MPPPDPEGLFIETMDNGRWRLLAEIWAHGNRRHRLARLSAVSRNLRQGGWTCRACGGPIPVVRRADARYCSEGCRKREARARRANRARQD